MTVEAGAPTKPKAPAGGWMSWVRKVRTVRADRRLDRDDRRVRLSQARHLPDLGEFLDHAGFAGRPGGRHAGLLVPLTANDFDLSIAYTMTLSSMTIAVLNVNHGIGIGWAIIAALAAGAVIGLINGLLITIFRIHSLIVTLGVGTFLHGVTLWMSDSMTISGVSQSLIRR